MKSFTVWTIKEGYLYLMAEIICDEGVDVSIFVFAHV
jgi:hypothetical protein